MKKDKLKNLYIAICKAKNKLLEDHAKLWFKEFINKSWYSGAVKAYAHLASAFQTECYLYQKELLNILCKTKQLFKIVKDDEVKRYKTWEYLDEAYNKVVVPDIQDTLIVLEESFKAKMEEIFNLCIADYMLSEVKKVFTVDTPFNFNQYDAFTKDYLEAKKIKWAKEVSDTTTQSIKQILVSEYQKGSSIDDIARRIKHSSGFSMNRAEKVARTEIMSASNYVDYTVYNMNDSIVGYKWQSALGERTRPTHRRAHNQYREKGKPFIIGGYKMLHPQDGSYGAPAKEIVNCRCYLEPVFADKKEVNSGKETLLEETKANNLVQDTAEFKQYQQILGEKVPNTIEAFQNLKYSKSNQWNKLKETYEKSRPVKIAIDGSDRAKRFSKFWPKASLSEMLNKLFINYTVLKETDKGKVIYGTSNSTIQIVYDRKGNYFRIEDTSIKGKRRYLDLDGNNVANKFENGRQVGRSKSEYEAMTHFSNKDGD